MARPRKSNTENLATVRIEGAFWKLLETEKYSEITVLRISQEAGTNRNSFYYHYRDIEDLAYKAFKNNADRDMAGMLFSGIMSPESSDPEAPVIDPRLVSHARKIMLCAGSDSGFLNQMVHNLLKEMWFRELSIREDLLTPSEKLQVRFIFSGLTSVLGSKEVKESPLSMTALSKTEIGRSAISTLKRISDCQNTHN